VRKIRFPQYHLLTICFLFGHRCENRGFETVDDERPQHTDCFNYQLFFRSTIIRTIRIEKQQNRRFLEYNFFHYPMDSDTLKLVSPVSFMYEQYIFSGFYFTSGLQNRVVYYAMSIWLWCLLHSNPPLPLRFQECPTRKNGRKPCYTTFRRLTGALNFWDAST